MNTSHIASQNSHASVTLEYEHVRLSFNRDTRSPNFYEYILQARKERQCIFLYPEVPDVVRCPLKGNVTFPFLVIRFYHSFLLIFKE
jgi:hypothetical protein